MFNNAMMKQAKKMQEKMKEAQEEIAKMETEGSSGGISIKMIGGKLHVEISNDNHIFITGGARDVFEGMIDLSQNE